MVFEFASIIYSMPDRVEKRYMLLILSWLTLFANLIFVNHEFEQLCLQLPQQSIALGASPAAKPN